MLAPADAESASEDPQQLVPEARPSMRSASSRTGEHLELILQQQALDDEVVPRA
jgi:hypothetical protein